MLLSYISLNLFDYFIGEIGFYLIVIRKGLLLD